MKILLIDNETTLLQKLRDLIPGPEIVHKWNDLQGLDSSNFDLVVLSGGSTFQIIGNEKLLTDEMEIIRKHKTPLIGICYGCELIVKVFGGELEKMDTTHQGQIEIEMLDGTGNFNAFEHHTWRISELPKDFVALAQSEHSIEMIKHTSLPIYGFQFHPEVLVDQRVGERMFLDILKEISK